MHEPSYLKLYATGLIPPLQGRPVGSERSLRVDVVILKQQRHFAECATTGLFTLQAPLTSERLLGRQSAFDRVQCR
jgi:hypothetical protein